MDALLLTARVALSLGAVLALLWFLHRRFADRSGRTAERAIVVFERQPLGRRSSIVVVEAVGERFLLGVTDSTISLLASTSVIGGAAAESASRSDPPSIPLGDDIALLRDRRRRPHSEPTPFERVAAAARRRRP